MEITAAIKTVDITYYVSFKEPMFSMVREERREGLLREIVKAFSMRLNDIKIHNETPSNNYIHFSKFQESSFFDVSYGFEEVTALLRNPVSKDQVLLYYGALNECYREFPVALQRVTVQYHLSVEGDLMSYLNYLNPNTPPNFGKIMFGKGVGFWLKVEEHQLKIYTTMAPSLFIPGGLFISTDYEFSPSLYKFKDTFDLVEKFQNFLEKELSITIKR